VEPRFPSAARAGARDQRRVAVAVTFASACALYAVAYAGALTISGRLEPWRGLVAGLANLVPDAIAAPVVLRWAGRSRPGRRAIVPLVLLGVAFVAWSTAGAVLGLRLVFDLRPDWRNLLWKVIFALLVYGVLAGVARVRFHAEAAREASARALRAETLRAEARLAILRAQVEPHFILNVLQSLVGLAERDPAAASAALERLGGTLRYAQRVHAGAGDRVALRDELEFTRDYLALEGLRLGERLRVREAVAEGLLGRVVPPFVLQPLVENAVRHAVAPRAAGGEVALRADEADGALRLVVEDDGPGPTGAAERPGGLGLRLLRDRLEALYRGGASLTLDRGPMGGLRATLWLRGEPWAPGEEP
jgi:signal transduction histidine kinase